MYGTKDIKLQVLLFEDFIAPTLASRHVTQKVSSLMLVLENIQDDLQMKENSILFC